MSRGKARPSGGRFSTQPSSALRDAVRTLIAMETVEGEGVAPTARLPVHAVAFTALGVCVAFALAALPAPDRDYRALVIAACVGVALIGFSLAWRRWPRLTLLGIPLGFMLLAT